MVSVDAETNPSKIGSMRHGSNRHSIAGECRKIPSMTEQDRNHSDGQLLIKQRYELLHWLEEAIEKPLIVLGFLWLLLLVLELVQGENR